MSPEAINYMSIAEATLERAERNFLAEIYEDAARNAYIAALNASRAIIFHKTGLSTKTHQGARGKLFQLIYEGLPFPKDAADFLAKGFDMKQDVDYGPEIIFVTREEAQEYLKRAAAFLAAAKKICE